MHLLNDLSLPKGSRIGELRERFMAVIGAAQCGSAHDRRTSFLQLVWACSERIATNLKIPERLNIHIRILKKNKNKKNKKGLDCGGVPVPNWDS